jgi:hypothetical protein
MWAADRASSRLSPAHPSIVQAGLEFPTRRTMLLTMRMRLSATAAALFTALIRSAPLAAQSGVEVMVVGSLHLRQIDPDSTPVAVDVIRRSLQRFKPELIAVEWLHPSIDPATTFNYRPIGDLATLARLWGYRLADVPDRFREAEALVRRQKGIDSTGGAMAALRVELGKLYFLQRDQLNAGYQWWLAGELGGAVQELRRLTPSFAGHELQQFGFAVGRWSGVEYITPFDYQGADAEPGAWGDMLERLRSIALELVDRVRPGDPGWDTTAKRYDAQRQAFETRKDSSWLRRYGSIREVSEYVTVLRLFDRQTKEMPTTRDGLAQMRYLQSKEYDDLERFVQLKGIGSLSAGGMGQVRLRGIMNRNRHMIDFLLTDVARLGARRVMIVVGAAHKFALEDLLRDRGYTVVPSANYLP